MLKSGTYPRNPQIDVLDPLLDTYQVEGADAPEDRQGNAQTPSKKPERYLPIL